MLTFLFFIGIAWITWALVLLTIDVLGEIKYRKELISQSDELMKIQKELEKLLEELS